MKNKTQLNLVLEIDKNNIDDLNMMTQIIQEGWKVIHIGDLDKKPEDAFRNLTNLKVILIRIFE
jgi:hypothetical protein